MKIAHESQEHNILKWFVKHDSNLLMFHHRFPTSTINVAKAAHPISTKAYFGDTQYIMVHNGVIRNSDELFPRHCDLGINYSTLLDDLTFNDSESLLWDFALTMEGKQDKMKAHGDMAFICMKVVKGKLKQMMFGRNSRPLNMFRDKETIELSSEGRGVSIPPDILNTYDYGTRTLSIKEMTFPSYAPYEGAKNSGFGRKTGTHPSNYQSYDDWYRQKHGTASHNPESESNWKRLRRKYGGQKYLPESTPMDLGAITPTTAPLSEPTLIADILEAKKDKNGIFLVEHEHPTISYESVNVDSLDLKDYEPTAGEVQNLAMEYMIDARGNFEEAYANLESVYSELIGIDQRVETFQDIREQLLYEAALAFINSDPEYQNESSVSSVWQALWSQQSLLTV